MIEGTEQIGRGHGPESQLVDRRPRDQRHLGVDDGGFRRTQREAKGAGDARRIEQRLNGERIRRRVGLFDPELAEQRKFLARIVAGPNRKAARGEAEGLGVRPRAVEGRALEDRHVFEALVRGLEDAQAGKAEVAQSGRRFQRAEVEIGRVVDHPLRHAVLDNVDPDRRRVDETPMQRLERKAQFLVAPDRGARHALDRRVLIESEAREEARQRRRLGLLERLRGQFRRHFQHRIGGRTEQAGPTARRRPASSPTGPAKPRARRRRPAVRIRDAACPPSYSSFVRRNEAAHERPDTTSLPAKMKNQPVRRKNASQPSAFRPGLSGCISFFAAQRDAFCRKRQNRVDAGGVGAGNRARPRR